MVEITYPAFVIFISVIWIFMRACVWFANRQVKMGREAKLMLVYICLIVVARFTFFPFSKVEGQIQPLVFDVSRLFPLRINLIPFIYLLDYPKFSEALLNLIGNTAMFIPLGIIWPAVFRGLDTHKKVIAAGFGVSLFIEILQLPFYDRVSDIDDLILNSLGFMIGYGIYLFTKLITKNIKNRRK